MKIRDNECNVVTLTHVPGKKEWEDKMRVRLHGTSKKSKTEKNNIVDTFLIRMEPIINF